MITVDNEIFYKIPEGEQEILCAKFADPLFVKFLTHQVEAAKLRMGDLDPATAKTPEAFFQAAKDARLILQFWTNFLHFAEDWGKSSGVPTTSRVEN